MAMRERLGQAVLELTTDNAPLKKGLASAKGDFKSLGSEVQSFAQSARAGFSIATVATTALVGGLALATAKLITLGQRGADVADVRGQFDQLSRAVGSTGAAMLGALQSGTQRTIGDFALMQAANKALSSGLVATAGDFETMAAGARLAANRTGGDAVEAFYSLTSAMASGRTAALKQLGIFVDSKVAVENYAKAHQIAAGDMNDAQRAAALQAETIKVLKTQLQEAGADSLDFADRVDQLKTRWSNFTDGLSEAIATSPVVGAALASIGEAAERAFGNDQTALVQKLTGYVNRFAIGVVDAAKMGVTAAGVLRQGWGVLELAFSGTASVVFLVGRAFTEIIATAAELAAKLPGVGSSFQTLATDARNSANEVAAMQDSFHDQAAEALEAVKGNSKFQQTLDAVSGSLTTMRGRMVDASREQAATGETTTALTGRTRELTEASTANAAAMKAQATATAQAAKAQRDFTNFVEERRIEDAQRAMDGAEADAAAQRRFTNEVEEQRIRDHEAANAAIAEQDTKLRGIRNDVEEALLHAQGERNAALEAMRQQQLERWKQFGSDMLNTFTGNLADMLTGTKSFKEGFLGIWQGIKASFANILQGMLNDFIGGFAKKALSSLMGGPGGQGGPGGGFGDFAKNALPGFLPSFLPGGGPPGGPPVGPDWLQKVAQNPWTLPVALGIAALTWAIGEKGLFRGGEEALHVNPRRDQFLAQFGPAGTDPKSGFGRLAAQLSTWTKQPGGGSMFQALTKADSVKKYEAAQSAIVQAYAAHGKRIQSFNTGTPRLDFMNFGRETNAKLHGEEAVVPIRSGHRLAGEIATGLLSRFSTQAMLDRLTPPRNVFDALQFATHGGREKELVLPCTLGSVVVF